MDRMYVDWLLNANEEEARVWAATCRLDLEASIKDSSPEVRAEVARQGYGLDRLISDPSERVRATVASLGYGLEILVEDSHPVVRAWVANQGYALDRLIMDESSFVRESVAHQGYKLETLLDDVSSDVRYAVAKQGFGLDTLIKDEDYRVRLAVATHGFGLEQLVNDVNSTVRCEVAKHGFGLDILVNDPEWPVRAAVARQGYGLEKLVRDESELVRYEANSYPSAPAELRCPAELRFEFRTDLSKILPQSSTTSPTHFIIEPFILLMHAIGLYLLSGSAYCCTMNHFFDEFAAEIYLPQMFFEGMKAYNNEQISALIKRATSLHKGSFERRIEALEKSKPGHVAAKFYSAYKDCLRESFVFRIAECNAANSKLDAVIQ